MAMRGFVHAEGKCQLTIRSIKDCVSVEGRY